MSRVAAARLGPRPPRWLLALLLLAAAARAAAASEVCTQFSKYYASLGHTPLDAPPRAAAAADAALVVCPAGTAPTCCTLESEKNLVLSSKQWLTRGLSPATHAARSHLHRLSVEMDEFFSELLTKAHRELHGMFSRAYGAQYVQNADVFDRLFGRFRGYYGGSDADLAATVHGFFADIFSRMYKMLNPADKAVTSSYLDRCVGGQLERLAPFGDIPARLGQGVRRALVVARTFMQGLAVGHHAFLTATNWAQNPSAACLHTITRMLHCAACAADGAATTNASSPQSTSPSPPAHAEPRRMAACHAGCVTAVRSCFGDPFIDVWDKYVSSMDAVGARLEDEGAFNLESVLGPLKDSISAAIMDYNNNHLDIEKKISTIPGCQKGSSQRLPTPPNESRGKRSAAVRAPSKSGALRAGAAGGGGSSEQSLRRLVADSRAHLRRLRGMWKNLDGQLCVPSMGVAAPSNSSSCTSSTGSESSGSQDLGRQSLNATELSLDAADDSLGSLANATRLLALVTAHLKEAMGEQRNITWLRVQQSDFLAPSDADDVGTRTKAEGSAAVVVGSGAYSDVDRDSSGSGDDAAGSSSSRRPSKLPRPLPTWAVDPPRPVQTGPTRRRPPWDGQDDDEDVSGDGSGMPGGNRLASSSSSSTKGPLPPTGNQRFTSRPVGSKSAPVAGSGGVALDGQALWHVCLLLLMHSVAFSAAESLLRL